MTPYVAAIYSPVMSLQLRVLQHSRYKVGDFQTFLHLHNSRPCAHIWSDLVIARGHHLLDALHGMPNCAPADYPSGHCLVSHQLELLALVGTM